MLFILSKIKIGEKAVCGKEKLNIFTGASCVIIFLVMLWPPVLSASSDCDQAVTYAVRAKFPKDKNQAYENYKKAIQLCPGYIRVYELLGNLYRKDGDRVKAIEYFSQAAELGTTNYKLYYLLAELLFEKGDMDGASLNLKKSLSIREDYPKALKLKEEIDKTLDQEGPTIILFEPSQRRGFKIVHRYQNLTVRGMATDKSGLAWIKINQSEASLDTDGNFLKDISIRTGPNEIVIEAADSLGNTSRLSMTIQGEDFILPVTAKIQGAEKDMSFYEKSHAVVVGINQYNHWPVLEFAVNDAQSVKKSLEMTGFDEITMILDQEASQSRILTEFFHTLPQKVNRNDRVLFYFAGHGQTEDLSGGGKRGYIIPVDADRLDYSTSAISMEQIRSLSNRISAKHILFIMDSCYSGLGLSRALGISPTVGGYLSKIASMRAVQVVTAGGSGEQVQERDGHGLFTTYFLKGIQGEADINNDKVVTATELGTYLRPTVSDASQQAQTPLYGRLEGEGDFLFFMPNR